MTNTDDLNRTTPALEEAIERLTAAETTADIGEMMGAALDVLAETVDAHYISSTTVQIAPDQNGESAVTHIGDRAGNTLYTPESNDPLAVSFRARTAYLLPWVVLGSTQVMNVQFPEPVPAQFVLPDAPSTPNALDSGGEYTANDAIDLTGGGTTSVSI